jgi:tetratricopeptide (TPR) repeat protein
MESADAVVGDCRNCLSNTHLLPCLLCLRQACDRCRRKSLCNICCSPGTWTKKVAATQKLEAARSSFIAGRLKDALTDIQQAVVVNPQDPSAYTLRAQCHLHLGLEAAALADVNIAIELGGTLPALAQRMMLFWESGDTTQAKADAEDVLRRLAACGSDDVVQANQLALVRAEWIVSGVVAGLTKCIEALITGRLEELDRLEIHLTKARLHLLCGEWGQAVSEASLVRVESERLFRIFLPRSLLSIGKALQGCGLYKEALSYYGKAMEATSEQQDEECLVFAAIASLLTAGRSAATEQLQKGNCFGAVDH